ncbi:carboxylesterase/lipase family protein [Mycobacterium sp. SMC-4]|uniref:carboxylesterase/lipase family protein n=1 Tax=Mycobacterium sp. SMC-4 TaxID=2857059 RepID=UPI0021B36280|nr:carboxylesterase family protein [Mycobacterium sp. SMC-4]UXA18927.1 carboxylesterase family protein [Mycobacterium sp. SMC-4]
MPIRALGAVVILLLALACAGPSGPAPAPGDRSVVQTSAGALRGVDAPGHRFFGGIAYAAPPVGPLRLRPPQPAPGWDGVRDAGRPGPRCLQAPGPDPEFGRHSDEDCLFLNVWAPAVIDGPKAVMVWFHGGSFVNGNGAMFDAGWLVERGDIVVVTLNYRLGALGFLAHPALGAAGEVGNYGLADQQAALGWVRDNIAAFGGDPDRVTVAGESAGAMSVCDHLVAPGSQGLFHGAIIMSGPCQAQAALAHAQRVSLDYAAAAGCADPQTAAGCLREAAVDRLREPVFYARLGADELSGPVTGSAVLPVDPLTAAADGTTAPVPVLIGTTADEFTLFTALRQLRTGESIDAQRYPQALAEVFGPDAAAVAQRYPPARYDDPALAYSAALTDAVFACVADRLATDLGRNGPVYAYEFADRAAPVPEPLTTLPYRVGASHSLDVRYLFDVGGAPDLSAAQRELSHQMIDHWSGFVRTGSPGPDWPQRGLGQVMRLHPDGNQVVGDYARAHQCEFWAGLG